MANVLNRTTKQYLRSVNTPDFPTDQWIINPVIPDDAASFEPKYWNISGDSVSLMGAPSRAIVDAGDKAVSRGRNALQLDNPENINRATMLALVDELNAQANKINAILDAINRATNVTSLKGLASAITPQPQHTPATLRASIHDKLGS